MDNKSVSQQEMIKKLKLAAEPLVRLLQQEYDPHTSIIVENDFVRVVRDDIGVPFTDEPSGYQWVCQRIWQ